MSINNRKLMMLLHNDLYKILKFKLYNNYKSNHVSEVLSHSAKAQGLTQPCRFLSK